MVERRISKKQYGAPVIPVERSERQTKCFAGMLNRREARISRNAAGFLIAAIRRNFTLPPEIQIPARHLLHQAMQIFEFKIAHPREVKVDCNLAPVLIVWHVR